MVQFSSYGVTMKISMVKMIKYWNQYPPFNTILYDRRFVGLLLTKVIGKENLANLDNSKKKVKFVQGNTIVYSN